MANLYKFIYIYLYTCLNMKKKFNSTNATSYDIRTEFNEFELGR